MPRLFIPRQVAFGAAVLWFGATTVAAQPGGRMRVLVPDFASAQGAVSAHGAKLSQQLRKQINQLSTHAAVGTDEQAVKDGLKEFGLKASDMDCIKWLQLAAQKNIAQLVLCGQVDEATRKVSARFTPIGGGEPFAVPDFTLQTPAQGALQVVASFNTYITQLKLAVYCDEYSHNHSWQQALDACTRALELNPKSAAVHYARAVALRELDRADDALQGFRKVLELDPVNTDAMLSAGLVAARLRLPDVSQQYFHHYLELNPGNEAVRVQLGLDLANAGDPAGALELMQEVTSRPGASATAHRYAGFFAANAALARLQLSVPAQREAAPFFQQAISNFERAIQLQPDSVDAQTLRQLMLAYRSVGNIEKALEIGRQATSTVGANEAQTWSVYAEVLKDAKQLNEAVLALDRMGQIEPEFPQLNARKAALFLELARLSDAVTAIKAAATRNEIPAATVEALSEQITLRGYQNSQAKRYDVAIAHFAAAREVGKSERSHAMANFFHGATVFLQADALLRGDKVNAAAARQAKPLLERARTLLEAAGAYTDQAAKRVEILGSIKQFTEMADALIKAGK